MTRGKTGAPARRLPVVLTHGWPYTFAEMLPAKQGFCRADIPQLRKRRPGLLDFATWLEQGGATKIAQLFDQD